MEIARNVRKKETDREGGIHCKGKCPHRPKDAVDFAGGITGGSVTAILIKIPGAGTSIVTLLDGYPMTKKGEASRALGAALTSSGVVGALAALLALPIVVLILPLAMSIISADMVFVILIGLAFVAMLGRGSMVKGLISGGIGLAISMIGYDNATA